jgi:hypothetical protein
MLWLVATALIASTPQNAPSPTRASAQATAMVRVVTGVRLRLDGGPNADAPPPRESVVHTEGAPRPARLIEFQ